jgi:hypothetical protein
LAAVRQGFCLELQVAVVRIAAEFILQRAFDIHGMGAMALDEVGILAVHRTDQIGERRQDAGWKTRAKPSRLMREIKGQIRDLLAMAGPEKQGLHQCDPFIAIYRFNVRFHDRSDAIGKHLHIRYIRIQQQWRRPEKCPLECPESFEL